MPISFSRIHGSSQIVNKKGSVKSHCRLGVYKCKLLISIQIYIFKKFFVYFKFFINILCSYTRATICTRVRAEDTQSPPKIFPPYAKLLTIANFGAIRITQKFDRCPPFVKCGISFLIQFLLHFPFTGRHHQGFDPHISPTIFIRCVFTIF